MRKFIIFLLQLISMIAFTSVSYGSTIEIIRYDHDLTIDNDTSANVELSWNGTYNDLWNISNVRQDVEYIDFKVNSVDNGRVDIKINYSTFAEVSYNMNTITVNNDPPFSDTIYHWCFQGSASSSVILTNGSDPYIGDSQVSVFNSTRDGNPNSGHPIQQDSGIAIRSVDTNQWYTLMIIAGIPNWGITEGYKIFPLNYETGEYYGDHGNVRAKASANVDSIVVIGAVPIPGAAWLFGSAIIGIVGLRKKLKGISTPNIV